MIDLRERAPDALLADKDFHPHALTAKGGTPMGEAINIGIDLLAARQTEYRQNGITPYRPWFFLISDGAPTDDWSRAARRVREGEARKSFSFFTVGVDGADTDTLGHRRTGSASGIAGG